MVGTCNQLAQPLDYVVRLKKLSEELLHSHAPLLSRKNICGKQQLIRAIRLDLDKLTHALVEAKQNRALFVLTAFFGDAASSNFDVSDVSARLADERIFHVGFEIHEPIALVLYGINHWIEHTKRALNVHMAVRDYLHFPASPAFQERVGAYAEIMRIWLEVEDRVLMLELFDIQRPADSNLASPPRVAHRNFHPLFAQSEYEAEHAQRLAQLFSNDEIWHYAFHVKTTADVDDLHRELQAIAGRHGQFSMAYRAPVYNQHDRSFHTKVIRGAGPGRVRLELEFVTDNGD